MANRVYSKAFYNDQSDASARSANLAIDAIMNHMPFVKTVLDIGCGRGTWVKAFLDYGLDAHGVDGPWARDSGLVVADDHFTSFNFAVSPIPFSIDLPREKFDLVTSFEVLEHIEPSRADDMVELISSKGDLALIGAAMPGQGGTDHVNEQWPAYWANKFRAKGYIPLDCIRPLWWNNPQIETWYSQNTILYARGDALDAVREFASKVALENLEHPLPLIHPVMLTYFQQRYNPVSQTKHLIRGIRNKIRS
jgi:SAM-dependent methyltransferase